jgi:hypothetical protein
MCWRMEKHSWDWSCEKRECITQSQGQNILHVIKRRKAN